MILHHGSKSVTKSHYNFASMEKWLREAGIKKPVPLQLIDAVDIGEPDDLGKFSRDGVVVMSSRHRVDLVKFILLHEIGHLYQAANRLSYSVPRWVYLDEADASRMALKWGAVATGKKLVRMLSAQGVL